MDATVRFRAMELLGRFNDELTRVVDDAFGTEWAEIEEILAILALVTDHAVTTRQLAERSGMHRRAVTRTVERLRAAGLVLTRASAGDGRAVEVVLTSRGERQAAMLRTSVAAFFVRSADVARELSGGTLPAHHSPPRPAGDPTELLMRLCEAGASLVGFMPEAATQGRLAARQRAALVQIATQDGVRPSDLVPSLGVSRAGVAYIIDQLTAKGFVRRRRGVVSGDRRAVILEPTREGTAAVHAVLDGIERRGEALAQLFAEVTLWQPPRVGPAQVAVAANRED